MPLIVSGRHIRGLLTRLGTAPIIDYCLKLPASSSWVREIFVRVLVAHLGAGNRIPLGATSKEELDRALAVATLADEESLVGDVRRVLRDRVKTYIAPGGSWQRDPLPRDSRAALVALFRSLRITDPLEPLLAGKSVDEEIMEGRDLFQGPAAPSHRSFVALARRKKEELNGNQFYGYVKEMLYWSCREKEGTPAVSLARIIRGFAHRWSKVLVGYPPVLDEHSMDALRLRLRSNEMSLRVRFHIVNALAQENAVLYQAPRDYAFAKELVYPILVRWIQERNTVAVLVSGTPGLHIRTRPAGVAFNIDDLAALVLLNDTLRDDEPKRLLAEAKLAWAQCVEQAGTARTSTGASAVSNALATLYEHSVPRAINLSHLALSQPDSAALGPYISAALEVLMGLLSRHAVAPRATDRHRLWDAQNVRILRHIAAQIALALRPLRRKPALGPARKRLRTVEVELLRALVDRVSPLGMGRNRLDFLVHAPNMTPVDAPLLARGALYFHRWVDESDRQMGRALLRGVPWGPGASQVLELMESRDLAEHVRAFVQWQATGEPMHWVPHIRPEDFRSVEGGEERLREYCIRASESALTGVMHEVFPWAPAMDADSTAEAVGFLLARGIYYRRISDAFFFQVPGKTRPFIAGFSAWTTKDPGPGYMQRMAYAIGGDNSEHVFKRIATAYEKRAKPVRMPALLPVAPPAPATAPSIAPRVPVPLPLPTAPTITPPAPAPLEDLELVTDLTRYAEIEDTTKPMQIHIAARGTLGVGKQPVYVELTDRPIYKNQLSKLMKAMGKDHVRKPMHVWRVTREELNQPRFGVWADALRDMDSDIAIRKEELHVVKKLREEKAIDPVRIEMKFRIRSIEPIKYIPMAKGKLVLLVYDDDPARYQALDAGQLTDASHTALDALLTSIGDSIDTALSMTPGAVVDEFTSDLFLYDTVRGRYVFRGIDCFLPWPLYVSYVKRPAHAFYTHVMDTQDEGLEPPAYLVPTFGETWDNAVVELDRSPEAMLARMRDATGMSWPTAAELTSSDEHALVSCAATMQSKGITTPAAFSAYVETRLAALRSALREALLEQFRARMAALRERAMTWHNRAAGRVFELDAARQRRFAEELDLVLAGDAINSDEFTELPFSKLELFSIARRSQLQGMPHVALDPDNDTISTHEELGKSIARVGKDLAKLEGKEEAKAVKKRQKLQAMIDELKREHPAAVGEYNAAKKRLRVKKQREAVAVAHTPHLAELAWYLTTQKIKQTIIANKDAGKSLEAQQAFALGLRQNDDPASVNGRKFPAAVVVVALENLYFDLHVFGTVAKRGPDTALFLEQMETLDWLVALSSWKPAAWLLHDSGRLSVLAAILHENEDSARALFASSGAFGARLLHAYMYRTMVDPLIASRHLRPAAIQATLLEDPALFDLPPREDETEPIDLPDLPASPSSADMLPAQLAERVQSTSALVLIPLELLLLRLLSTGPIADTPLLAFDINAVPMDNYVAARDPKAYLDILPNRGSFLTELGLAASALTGFILKQHPDRSMLYAFFDALIRLGAREKVPRWDEVLAARAPPRDCAHNLISLLPPEAPELRQQGKKFYEAKGAEDEYEHDDLEYRAVSTEKEIEIAILVAVQNYTDDFTNSANPEIPWSMPVKIRDLPTPAYDGDVVMVMRTPDDCDEPEPEPEPAAMEIDEPEPEPDSDIYDDDDDEDDELAPNLSIDDETPAATPSRKHAREEDPELEPSPAKRMRPVTPPAAPAVPETTRRIVLTPWVNPNLPKT